LVALRSFLRFAAREEWLPGDLGTTIDVPKLPERLPKPLKAGDRDRLLEALPRDTLAHKRPGADPAAAVHRGPDLGDPAA
jgi:site-specific recombinase XerD